VDKSEEKADCIQLAEIFRCHRKGYLEGKTQGEFVATGQVPEFYEALRELGVALGMCIF
jgi:pilus assembly protein CpaF